MLGRCNAVVTLMYQLIYGAIGYEGDYTDYGIRGWPLKRYPQDVNQSFPNTDAVEEALDAPIKWATSGKYPYFTFYRAG